MVVKQRPRPSQMSRVRSVRWREQVLRLSIFSLVQAEEFAAVATLVFQEKGKLVAFVHKKAIFLF